MASARISRALAAALLLLAAPATAWQEPLPAARNAGFQPRRVATDLARILERMLLDPDTGRRYADALRRNAADGRYDDIADRAAFAARLTSDLQQVSREGHLRVLAGPGPHAEAAALPPPAIEAPGWIAPGIAYLRLNNMLGAPQTLDSLARFLEDHAEARSLIIDLRDNSGGGMAEMDAILPWLYRAPALLMRMDSRAGVGRNPMGDIPSMRPEPAPPGILRYDHWVTPRVPAAPLADANVYVLTSSSTVSAAEHLALALKQSGRARIVGETTSGAGHYGPIVPLTGGFAAFVPVGRSYLAATGRGWEGEGVTPDIPVPEAEALSRALALAGLPEAEAARLSAGLSATLSAARRR